MDGIIGGLLGYLQDPRRTQQVQGMGNALEKGLLRLQESDKRFKELADRAFDPKNPGRIKDKEALKELTDMTMTGLLGFAPAGITKQVSLPEFLKMAQKGKVNIAKTEQQEIDDLLKGKSKFAELSLNWEMPASYDIEEKLAKKGFQTFFDQNSGKSYFFKNKQDIDPILNAKNPIDYGRAYGYSDEDIANFYLTRRGGMEDIAYKDFLSDLK